MLQVRTLTLLRGLDTDCLKPLTRRYMFINRYLVMSPLLEPFKTKFRLLVEPVKRRSPFVSRLVVLSTISTLVLNMVTNAVSIPKRYGLSLN